MNEQWWNDRTIVVASVHASNRDAKEIIDDILVLYESSLNLLTFLLVIYGLGRVIVTSTSLLMILFYSAEQEFF